MRQMSSAMQAAITARVVVPVILVDLTFVTGTVYVHTGLGDLTWDGNTYKGVGSLGSVSTITESNGVEATGTSVTLSGIDPTLYADSLSEIRTGQPANIWLACLANGVIVDALLMFSGLIDQPTINETADDITIQLALETNLTNLQRATYKLYSTAEQRRLYPDVPDSGFDFVPIMSDVANRWG